MTFLTSELDFSNFNKVVEAVHRDWPYEAVENYFARDSLALKEGGGMELSTNEPRTSFVRMAKRVVIGGVKENFFTEVNINEMSFYLSLLEGENVKEAFVTTEGENNCVTDNEKPGEENTSFDSNTSTLSAKEFKDNERRRARRRHHKYLVRELGRIKQRSNQKWERDMNPEYPAVATERWMLKKR